MFDPGYFNCGDLARSVGSNTVIWSWEYDKAFGRIFISVNGVPLPFSKDQLRAGDSPDQWVDQVLPEGTSVLRSPQSEPTYDIFKEVSRVILDSPIDSQSFHLGISQGFFYVSVDELNLVYLDENADPFEFLRDLRLALEVFVYLGKTQLDVDLAILGFDYAKMPQHSEYPHMSNLIRNYSIFQDWDYPDQFVGSKYADSLQQWAQAWSWVVDLLGENYLDGQAWIEVFDNSVVPWTSVEIAEALMTPR